MALDYKATCKIKSISRKWYSVRGGDRTGGEREIGETERQSYRRGEKSSLKKNAG